MTAPTRTPHQILRDEADALSQRARGAAELAATVSVVAAHELMRLAERADKVGRIAERLEMDSTSERKEG